MRQWAVLITVFFSSVVFAQQEYKLLVKFTDKQGSAFSIDNPQEFLSPRAIERRARQSVSIQESDLPIHQEYLNQIHHIQGASLVHRSKWMNAVLISLPDSTQIPVISELPFVERTQLLNNPTISRPVEKQFEDEIQAREPLDYGKADNQTQMHNLHLIHQEGYTGEGIHIAVFDAGFNGVDTMSAFAYMRDNNRLLGMRDFVNPVDTDFYEATHGRTVLSTMAAMVPGSLIGTAPDASYYLFRTEDVRSETLVEEMNWLAAAEYADSLGVDVINSSLGYTRFDDAQESHTYLDLDGNTTIITKAADWAASKGMLVVSSAGNYANMGWGYIGAPADADSILAVGAVGADSAIASFSSYGPTADGRIKPDVAARGVLAYVIGDDGERSTSSGTSYASPILAGGVACLWQAFPNESNMNIIEMVKKYGHQSLTPDSLLGYGIPDLYGAYLELENLNVEVNQDYIEVYPNPVLYDFETQYFATEPKVIQMQIFDIRGVLVHENTYSVDRGRNALAVEVNWEERSAGIYLLRFTADDVKLIQKVVKF